MLFKSRFLLLFGIIIAVYFIFQGFFYKSGIKVSVIMPVYNAEKTVKRTLDSLLAQMLKEMEIIVVNDGSTDNTPEIVRSYMAKYPHIKMITQENAYVGAARNRGFGDARGEYVAFIDADDTVSADFYKKLYETAKQNQADVVAADHVISVWVKDNREELYMERQKFTNLGVIENLVAYREAVFGYLWDKIYRTAFLKEHGILGTLRRTPAEDNYFTTQVLMYADKMYVAKDTSYYYWRGTASETGVKYTSLKDEIVEMFVDLDNVIKEADIGDKKEKWLTALKKVRQRTLGNYYDCLKEEDKAPALAKMTETFGEDVIDGYVAANDNGAHHQLYQKVL